jgi:hypothetical protein
MDPKDIKHLNPKVAPTAGDPIETVPAIQEGPGDDPLDKIAEVHTRVLDTIAGFEKFSQKAEPEFKPVSDTFLATHKKHERELADYLRKSGRNPNKDGSFFGTVNSSLIEIRSWFEDVDDDVMDRVAEGEKHVLEGYEQARNASQSIEANAMLAFHIKEINAMMRAHGT